MYLALFELLLLLLPTSSPPHGGGQTEELVKALQDLENAASGDAAVRQKIASLPQEVQDVSLLEKITGKTHLCGGCVCFRLQPKSYNTLCVSVYQWTRLLCGVY